MAERLLPSWLQPCSSCGCSFPGLYRPFTHNSLKSEDLYNWIHSSRRTGGKKLVRDRKKRGIRKERKKERKSCISQRHGRLSHSKSQQQFMMKEEKRDWGVEKHYERKQQKTYLLGSFQIRWVGWFCYSTTFGCSVGILAAAGVSVCTRWMDVPLWIHPFVVFLASVVHISLLSSSPVVHFTTVFLLLFPIHLPMMVEVIPHHTLIYPKANSSKSSCALFC